MKTLVMCGTACAALALAASTDAGGASPDASAPGADPIETADPAQQTLDAPASAQPQPDPSPSAEGNAPDADPNPPASKAAAQKGPSTKKKTFVVWAQPGHESIGIGQLFSTSEAEAEALRAAGRARYASDAEIKAAKSDKDEDGIPHLTGV